LPNLCGEREWERGVKKEWVGGCGLWREREGREGGERV